MRTSAALKAGVLTVFAGALIWTAATQTGQAELEAREAVPAHATFDRELAQRHPDCVATEDRPERMVPATVLVQPFWNQTAPVTRMDFDRAWRLNDNDNDRDDVWFVAACRGQRP